MNVFSAFDGISCGQLALQRAGIKVDNYFASEVDKYAISITQKNFPNTIQLGDITKLDISNLPKIDLLLAGFPCQSFSASGKKLNFDDPRGQLLFNLIELRNLLKPTYFIFENVQMSKKIQGLIDELIGVEPVLINSALVSAQNRKRLYWTNIPNITQPADCNILLKDIVLPTDRPVLCPVLGAASRGRPVNGKWVQQIELNGTEKSNTLTTVPKDTLIVDIKYRYLENGNVRIYEGKSPTIPANSGGGHIPFFLKEGVNLSAQDYKNINYEDIKPFIRKLDPIECERLQTLPDDYTKIGIQDGKEVIISNSQRYKTIGNGWTVDVIKHILEGLKTRVAYEHN